MKPTPTREQLTIILNGLLGIVGLLVTLQLWLLAATINAYLGQDDSVIWPAAVASLACSAVNVVLFRYLGRAPRPRVEGPMA